MAQVDCVLLKKIFLSDKFLKISQIICANYQLNLEKIVDIMLTKWKGCELM